MSLKARLGPSRKRICWSARTKGRQNLSLMLAPFFNASGEGKENALPAVLKDIHRVLRDTYKLPVLNLLCCRFPVVAMGVLRWVDYTVSDKSYFKLNTDHTPLHLVLLDEVPTAF